MYYCIVGPEEDKDEAEGKEGDSSTDAGKGDPDDVTDPDEEPADDDSNCFESKKENNPWWAVDLGKLTKIGRVKVRAGKINGEFGLDYFTSYN